MKEQKPVTSTPLQEAKNAVNELINIKTKLDKIETKIKSFKSLPAGKMFFCEETRNSDYLGKNVYIPFNVSNHLIEEFKKIIINDLKKQKKILEEMFIEKSRNYCVKI